MCLRSAGDVLDRGEMPFPLSMTQASRWLTGCPRCSSCGILLMNAERPMNPIEVRLRVSGTSAL